MTPDPNDALVDHVHEQGPDPERLVLIVVGSTLIAERDHRPIAYPLRGALDRMFADAGDLEALVCSDLWFLNDASLARRPFVSLGAPNGNALSARALLDLPTVFAVDDAYAVHSSLDIEGDAGPARACVWGVSAEQTERAAQVFVERHAEAFVRAAAGLGSDVV